MKARAKQAFWPLRPIPTVRRFELACWLAAAILALALMLAPAAGSRAAAHVIAAPASPATAHLLLYRPNCIERILAHAAGKTEEAVAAQINLQCTTAGSTEPSSAAGSPLLSCGRPLTVRLTALKTRVAGCLGG
jgi:hypothetical protein